MRVLVVEDDFAQGFALADLLEAGGHTPIGPVLDGTAAIHFAQQSRPDLALVDLTLMHGDRGDLVARDLRTRFGCRSLFVTGDCSDARDHSAAALGCIAKPYTADDVLRSVQIAEQIMAGLKPEPCPPGLELYD